MVWEKAADHQARLEYLSIGGQRGLSWMKPLGDNPRPHIPDALLGILLHTVGVTGEQHGKV